uniref:tRNA (guanine(37)-N1)-methyltransferase n=1 Tax=Elaeophora elaphi TaxID=1147741 RepID=A0A158Q8P4_9BILA
MRELKIFCPSQTRNKSYEDLEEQDEGTSSIYDAAGLRIIDKLIKVIETELNAIGANKISMPILGAKEMWQKTGRWSAFESEMFHLNDKTKQAFCLQPTHEEMVTKLVAEQVHISYEMRQSVYPLMLYQTGPKFRDEVVVGHGLLRSREFLMNDLYSFDTTAENAADTYNLVSETYQRIFRDRLGINFYTVRADAGNIGGDMSHEYHLPCRTGRDSIAYCTKCSLGVNHDLLKRGEKPCCCNEECTSIIDTIEIAHTFQLGDLFTKKFGAKHRGQLLIMNCFGIGIGRLIAALINSMSPSTKALRLPYALTPFKVAVILPNKTQPKTMAFAQDVVDRLSQISSLRDDIFVDDRLDNSIGRRLLAAANLGIPHILVIGNRTARTLTSNPTVEYYKTEAYSDEPISVGDLEYVEVSRLITKTLLVTSFFCFSKEITLSIIIVPPKIIGRLIGCKEITSRTVERFCNKIKPVIDLPEKNEKAIVFNPEKIDINTRNVVLKTIEDLTGLTARFDSYNVALNYDDWPVKSCITAILPKGLEFGGFSQIGHIVHVNLREELLLYKKVIGRILLDKVSNCKTVVNKLDAIGHKYRTFELDLLAGEENYKTEVHEDKLRYQLDFSQVFYNPRLNTEHKRIVRKIGKQSIFYDCCAGIGPFVLPVVRNGSHHVLANDLNPNCIDYLKRNVELNHLSFDRLKLYNMDAAVFIKTVLADDLSYEAENYSISDSKSKAPTDAHVVMNLPGMSLQFLPYFRGCLHDKSNLPGSTLPFPFYVHCHFFVKAPDDLEDNWYFEEAQNLIRKSLSISKLNFTEVRFVRTVAGRKKMFCATFQFPDEFLFSSDIQELEVRKANNKESTEIKECSDGSNSNERAYAERTVCEMQVEELEPQLKKSKFG